MPEQAATDDGFPRTVRNKAGQPVRKGKRNGQAYCFTHEFFEPCTVCLLNEFRVEKFNEQEKLIKQVLQDQWEQAAKLQQLLHVPKVGDWTSLDAGYNTETFRKEINIGLRYTRKLLQDYPGWQDSNDLRQVVDLEIWMATKKYKDKMNGAIAYTIAKNQGRRFLKNQINEQTVPVEWPDGTLVLDDFGKPMTIPRCVSFDDRGYEEDGKPREVSPVEEAIATESIETKRTWMDDIRRKLPLLEALIKTWSGAKRTVAEALLENPESTVRDIPGVPRSTAARTRKVVVEEFRKIISSSASVKN